MICLLTVDQIAEFEKNYKEHFDVVKYWDKQLMKQVSHDEWMDTIKQRARTMRDVYLQNQQQITALFSELNQTLTPEIIEELYQMLKRLYYAGGYDDAAMMLHIVNVILPYYTEQNSMAHCIHLLGMKAVLTTDYYYLQTRKPEQYSYQDIHGKLHTYFEYYKELAVSERHVLIGNFYNSTCSLPMALTHEINNALDLYDELLRFRNDPEMIALDKDNKLILNRIETIHVGIWNNAENIQFFDLNHLRHFYELLNNEYIKQKEAGSEISDNVFSAYYYTSAYLKENEILDTGISWQQAYDVLIHKADLLLKRLEEVDFNTVDEDFLFTYYYPYQETSNYSFKIYRQMKDHHDYEFIRSFIMRGTKVLYALPKGEFTWLFNAIHAEWCTEVVSILKDTNEQEEMIKSIIVKGQIQTYIHSQMVVLLSEAILKKILSDRPELLLSLPWFTDRESIRKGEQELCDYVSRAALVHDIGKNRISGVINQQSRKLVDEEFELIRQHPEHPESDIFKYSNNFVQYYDIIAGHHKSYDGMRGYPEYFDNVHSPYRILIDLIRICDCLDAATDRLGRNYAGGKDIEEVFLEFEEGKGTSYNPELVELILKDEILKKHLKDIVENGRNEVYYQTYKEYFS